MKSIVAWVVILAGLLGGWIFLTSSMLVSLLAATSGIVLTSGFTLGHLIVALLLIGDYIAMTIAAYTIHPSFGQLFLEIGARIPYIAYWLAMKKLGMEPADMPKLRHGNGSGNTNTVG